MVEDKTCPKCKGSMKEGSYTGVTVDWENNKEPAFLKQSGRRIITYACEMCGYMESYVKK